MTGKLVKININIMLATWLVICMGCKPPPGDPMEGTGEPIAGVVEADSFRGNRTIMVRWRGDVNVDEYMLMRARDEADGVGAFEAVYRSRETNYIDTRIEMDIRYLYRLDKIGTGKVYPGQETALGVGNNAEADLNEPNNQVEEATALGTFKQGTMYYYRFSDGRVLDDVDWYKVKLGGGRTEYVQIREDGAAGMTSMTITLPGKKAIAAEQGKWYALKNEAAIERDIYLSVQPDVGSYVADGMAGGMIRAYTIIRSDKMEEWKDGKWPGSEGNEGGKNGGTGDPILPGEIVERSELFVPSGPSQFMFLLNDRKYQGRSYTFWRYLENKWNKDQGMEMVLVKGSGNYLGGYGYFFAGGTVAGYGDCKLVLLIQKDGNYAVGKVIDGKYTSVLPWTWSKSLNQGYGPPNTIGVKWDNTKKEYVLTINGVKETEIVDTKEPVCNGEQKGVVAVVSWLEDFPQTPVKVLYTEK